MPVPRAGGDPFSTAGASSPLPFVASCSPGPVLAAYFIGLARDLDWDTVRTFGFSTLVLGQLVYVYALRVSEGLEGWADQETVCSMELSRCRLSCNGS